MDASGSRDDHNDAVVTYISQRTPVRGSINVEAALPLLIIIQLRVIRRFRLFLESDWKAVSLYDSCRVGCLVIAKER